MARNDELWFDLGVRDNVSKTLSNLMKDTEKLAKSMADVGEMKNAYKNISDIGRAYEKIDEVLKRIKSTMSRTSDPVEKERLQEIYNGLVKQKNAYKDLSENAKELGVKGAAALIGIVQNTELAIRGASRYLNTLDSLQDKMRRLSSTRTQLQSAIANAGDGVDTSQASSLLRQITSRMGHVGNAIKNGVMPSSVSDHQIDDLIQKSVRAAKVLGVDIVSAQKAAAQAATDQARANEGLVKAFDDVTNAGNRQSKMMGELTNMAASYFSLYAAKNFATSIITRGGEFEVQHVALQNILGDMQEADRLFSELKGLALESPMTFMQLSQYTKQLAAFSIPSDELFDTTKRLADLSVGLGVDMSRLILAYGQVRSAAVLRGQELRQFTEAGIPLVKRLAEEFTRLNGEVVRTGDVFELISKRQVPFEMVQKILWDMTDEGGQFYDMQSKIAETLKGKMQKLSDAYEQFLGRLAEGNTMSGKTLKVILTTVTDLINNAEKLLPLLGSIAGVYGVRSIGKAANRFATAGAGNVAANIAAAQRQNALDIQREAILGRITKKRAESLLLQNASTQNAVLTLTQAGRLNTLQLAGLYLKREIKKEDIQRLVAEKAITAEEGKQIAGMTRLGLLKAQIGKGLGGFFSVGNMATIGIGVALAALGSLVSHFNDVKEAARKMREETEESASGLIKSSKEILSEYSDGTSFASVSEYGKAIVSLTEYLKENSASWKSVKESAAEAGDELEAAANRYEDLRERVKAVNEANKMFADDPEFLGRMIDNSGVNWVIGGNNEIDAQVKEAEKRWEKYGSAIRKVLKTHGDEIDEALSEIRKNYTAFDNAVKESKIESNLKAQLETLLQFPDAKKAFDSMFSRTDAYGREVVDMATPAGILNAYFESYESQWKRIRGQVEGFSNELKAKLREWDKDVDFSNLNKTQEEFVMRLLDDFFKKAGVTGGKVIEDFKTQLNSTGFNINVKINTDGEEELTGWKRKLNILTGNKYAVDIKALSNIVEASEFFKKKYEELKKDVEGAKPIAIRYGFEIDFKTGAYQPGKNTPWGMNQYGFPDYAITPGGNAAETVKTGTEQMNTILNAFKQLGLDTSSWDKGKHKGKGGGSNGEDKELKRLKERLEGIKAFYSEYKKYRKVYSKEESISVLESVFPDLKGKGSDIVNDYKRVLEGVAAEMEKRPGGKKSVLSVRKLIADIDVDKLQEDLQKALKEVERYIQDETSKWNLYKGLLEKTGSKDFAMQAFVDGVMWDDVAEGMRRSLEDSLRKRGVSFGGDLFDMGQDDAVKFFGEGTAELKLWEEIVKAIRKNWTDGLNEVAAATEKLMSAEEKVAKIERELADLRGKYGANDPRVMVKEQERNKAASEAFEESVPYLRFYSSILTMTADEAEKAGASIREHLVEQLARGEINADKYLKSIKNIDAQLEKSRNSKGGFRALMSGGISGYLQNRREVAENKLSDATIKAEQWSKETLSARKALYDAEKSGNSQLILAAKIRLGLAESELAKAKEQMDVHGKAAKKLAEQAQSLDGLAGFLDDVASAFGGLQQATQQISDMFDALGHEGSANTWSDISDTIGAIGSPFQEASSAIKSAMSGDIGGTIAHTVGIITSPVTAFAKLHDKKKQREIEHSERRVKALTIAYQNLQSAMENALGGIYTTGGYNEMLSNLKSQRDELARQYAAESGKKKSDSSKLADYEQQLKEMDVKIKDFALEMAKTLYDIDLHSWASELTDAVVSAWEKGEDAVAAYKGKVKDLMKDLTKNILAKKVMEKAFETLKIDDLISSVMTKKDGKLDENDIKLLADKLNEASVDTTRIITGVLDSMEKQGYIEKEGSQSSSVSSSIKGVTEETADLLASYINAIRADVSLNGMTLREMLTLMQGQGEMPTIARAQLQQLEIVAQNTAQTAQNTAAIGEIYALLRANTLGTNYFNVK